MNYIKEEGTLFYFWRSLVMLERKVSRVRRNKTDGLGARGHEIVKIAKTNYSFKKFDCKDRERESRLMR